MKNVFIINGHQPYPFAKGRLNASLVELAAAHLREHRYDTRVAQLATGWEVEEQIALHQWADAVLLQFPVNWMGTPWLLKKYMDEVYTAGMDGRLCKGDGRHSPADGHLYGLGGTLKETSYMLSVTLNAPREAFANPEATFFEGKGVDDLLWPTHLNLKFFGMKPLATFSAHDVMKNPEVESDFERFRGHLATHFAEAEGASS